MLDQIDLDRTIEKQAYKERLPEFQERLFAMQKALAEARVPVLFVFEGWAGTSKIGTIGTLARRLDPRGVRVYPVTPPRTSETHYPWLYRFWLKTPGRGEIAIFDRSWYRQVLGDRTQGDLGAQAWRDRCEDIGVFERQLAEDGALILKFWLHISKKEQGRRFRKLLSDPITAWQVTKEDRWQHRHYDSYRAAVQDMLLRTDAPLAPWVTLPATDRRYARLAVFETVLGALESHLGRGQAMPPPQPGPAAQNGAAEPREPQPSEGEEPPHAPAAIASPGILRRADLSLRLDEKHYDEELAPLQAKLHLLGHQVYLQKRPVVLVFEGWDAAGKGGTIRRITQQLDPRSYVVHSIAAPTSDEKAHHYLYRFWNRLPPQGEIAIFDRSWYGRVLVERVEGFARPDEWQRAFAEIAEFERQLLDFGSVLCKFWMHISPEEQLRRFEDRQQDPYKSWKLTDEDWRNREKWPQYEHAADELLLRTSTPAAPWTLVEAEDKRFGRIKVLRTVVQRLEEELGEVKL
jgi:polyphosphate kinase 2 (PPK2 family)